MPGNSKKTAIKTKHIFHFCSNIIPQTHIAGKVINPLSCIGTTVIEQKTPFTTWAKGFSRKPVRKIWYNNLIVIHFWNVVNSKIHSEIHKPVAAPIAMRA